MKKLIVLLLALAVCGRVSAQGIGPDDAVRDIVRFSNPTARHVTDITSTIAVAAALATPCLQDRTWKCLGKEGTQVGVSILVSELIKHFVHRTRPDGSDNKSFLSEHSDLACVVTLGTKYWAMCPGVMFARIAADKHWLTDTLGGLGAAATVKFTVTW